VQRVLNLAIVLGLLLAPCCARAQSADPEVVRSSIDCEDVSVQVALRTLFRNVGVRFEVRGRIPEARVTLKLLNVPIEDALKVLVRQLAFTEPNVRIFQKQGLYVVRADLPTMLSGTEGAPVLPDAEPTTGLLGKTPVDTAELPLRVALDRLFSAAGASVMVDPDVPEVSTTTPRRPGSPLWSRISQLIESARSRVPQLYVGQIGEVYVVARLGRLIPPRPAELRGDGVIERRISLKLAQVPLRVAIDTLFARTGEQYSVNPDVPNVPITLELQDVGFQAALRFILRKAGEQVSGLTYSED
jgi:hypothetical protein